MDKYYKWDGTVSGVEGLEIFAQTKASFIPDTNVVQFVTQDGVEQQMAPDETLVVLEEGDTFVIPCNANVDVAIAQYRAARNASAEDDEDDILVNLVEGTFEWALSQLSQGKSVRCKAWKKGRVITPAEAQDGEWELA